MTEHEQQPPCVQDSILKTNAPLRISASVSDDNWWNPQNAHPNAIMISCCHSDDTFVAFNRFQTTNVWKTGAIENARWTSKGLKVKIDVFKCKWRHVIESSPRSSLITTHFLVTVYGRIWRYINKILTLFLSHAGSTLIFNQQRMLLKLPKLSLKLICTWLRFRSFWVNPVLIKKG